MSIFYSRLEDEKEITIIFTSRALQYWLMIAMIVSAILPVTRNYWIYVLIANVIFMWVSIIGSFSVRREIKKAMENGSVSVSGKVMSFSKPLTYKIKK